MFTKMLIQFYTQELLHLGTPAPCMVGITNPKSQDQKWPLPTFHRTNDAIPFMHEQVTILS